jgi:hypothetical protein
MSADVRLLSFGAKYAAFEDNNFTNTDELIRAMVTYPSRQSIFVQEKRSSFHWCVQIAALNRLTLQNITLEQK